MSERLTDENLERIRSNAFNSAWAFDPEEAKALIAEIDRLKDENAEKDTVIKELRKELNDTAVQASQNVAQCAREIVENSRLRKALEEAWNGRTL